MNIDNEKFNVPANNVEKKILNKEEVLRTNYVNIFEPEMNKNLGNLSNFATSHLSIFDGWHSDMTQDARIEAITNELADAPLEEILPKIPKSEQSNFLKLRQSWDKFESDTKLDPVSNEAVNFFNSRKTEYAEFLDNSRPNPSKVSDPHPDNVRVLAAVSQNQLAAAENPVKEKGKPDWVTRKFSDALSTEQTIDAAIDKTSKEVTVDYNSINYLPFIQKPVSTKRENNTAWTKSDNDNPNVKRVIIFNVTEDEAGGMQSGADKIRQNFYTPDEKASDSNENRFRVDKIIYVTPPTKEEEKQGITQTDKTRKAFEQCKAFMEEQKASIAKQAVAEGKDPKAAVKDLKFEGMANWFGHGTTVANKSPKENDPKHYQEGSAEFKFIISPKEGIEESEIKKMEQNIKDFSYFPQYFVSCHSGAMIN